ncbi:hypothetical protein AGLY_017257 [Aphis glycines]|uniref:Transposable element P transposase-like GTP-binding insertion domain-containing protein n=1 Tax=Aphis glycines TaxID=307491 RepID=A0A6G0SW76_APHGL|nr:hypothetical protein AGLY_017257 [Aphis glycines]
MKLDPSKPLVKWEHFSEVFRLDENKLGKVCPKITRNHIYLTSLSKMKVKFATQILENAMKWLDSWESKVIDGLISSNEFLTQQTADGLRVTIKSSIELSKICWTINVDCIFSNKPPKSGNCTINEVQKPVLEICDFKDLISNESLREEKIKNMKSKLDLIIEDKNWDCEDIFLEHDYTKSSVFECVVYYLGEYLARRLCKKSKCEVCIKNLKNDGNLGMESELVNLKSKGFLTHPSVLETCFCKHASASDVFENTYNEFFLHVTSLTFSCSIHKYEMIKDIFTIAKKKLSKLVSS